MTIAQRKKKVEELTKQIQSLMNCRDSVSIRRGFTTTTTNVRKHGWRKQALKNAIKARAKHQMIIDREEKNGTQV